MTALRVRVAEADDGRRIDQVLAAAAAGPRSLVMKWLRTGAVRRNGEVVTAPGERVRAGDTIEVAPGPAAARAPGPRPGRKGGATAAALDVLYEDDALLVVDKPAGLACHAGTLVESDSLAARVAARLAAAGRAGVAAGLAQRLDRGVSGVVPFGIGAEALRALAASVESGAARKTYLAIVSGVVRADSGTIDVPLRVTDEPMGNRPKTLPDPERGLPAITRFRVVRRFEDASLLEVTIETGRTHQIRAHLLFLGHPISGDPRYGEPARDARLRETFGIDRPLLHASRLSIPHPVTGAIVTAEAPLPPDFARLLHALR